MVFKRTPPHKVKSPTNYPELKSEWKRMYRRLRNQGHKKSNALEIIGQKYSVSRQTVMYHLFVGYKNSKKNCPSHQWSYEKTRPEIYKRRILHSKHYMWITRHLDEYIEHAYQCTPLNGSLTLEELSDKIYAICNVSFHPTTIHKLVKHYETERNQLLIVKNSNHDPLKYSLALSDQS